MRVAAAVAVVTAGLLALRESLHGWLESLTWPELRSGLILLAMTFIALPLVPDDPVGPFGGVNPREIWLIAIVLAGVSFLGYAAVKYFGERHGVLLAAAAGGLVSSTAVTFANARRAASRRGRAATAGGRRIAGDGGVVGARARDRRACSAEPAGTARAVACRGDGRGRRARASYWVYGPDGDGGEQTTVKLRNPFGFWSVIGLAAAMGAIVLLGRFLNDYFGSAGAIIGAATLGLFDVDAVTVSMSRLVPQPLSLRDGAFAILAAVASNTVSKLVIGAGLGGGRFAPRASC